MFEKKCFPLKYHKFRDTQILRAGSISSLMWGTRIRDSQIPHPDQEIMETYRLQTKKTGKYGKPTNFRWFLHRFVWVVLPLKTF